MTKPSPDRTTRTDSKDTTFTAVRPRLFAVAYRMLDSRADVEDVLQDTWIRWHQTDQAVLQSAEAWLVTVVIRLSIDHLHAAKTKREAYVGQWLPELLVESESHAPTPETVVELAGGASMALSWVLERLSPREHAAFLMRQVSDQDYLEIATLLGKTEATCRQMVHRVSGQAQQERPCFDVAPDAHRDLLECFAQASRTDQRDVIRVLLADDAQLTGDGGGKVLSFTRIIQDASQIVKIYCELVRATGDIRYIHARMNGEPGLLRHVDGKLESAQSFVIENDQIVAIYVVRGPDKLAHIGIGAQKSKVFLRGYYNATMLGVFKVWNDARYPPAACIGSFINSNLQEPRMLQAPRITYLQLAPGTFNNLLDLLNGPHRDLLDARLISLMLLRASQVNGCTFYIDMHWADLIKMGEDPRHLNAVAGWRKAPLFTEHERGAALRWAELVTSTSHSNASDEEFVRLREYFSDEEIAELSLVIVTINSRNLLNVSLRNPVPLKVPHAAAA